MWIWWKLASNHQIFKATLWTCYWWHSCLLTKHVVFKTFFEPSVCNVCRSCKKTDFINMGKWRKWKAYDNEIQECSWNLGELSLRLPWTRFGLRLHRNSGKPLITNELWLSELRAVGLVLHSVIFGLKEDVFLTRRPPQFISSHSFSWAWHCSAQTRERGVPSAPADIFISQGIKGG